jgi:4-hydroxy-2-oxoglutarate aldolase
VRRRPGGVFAPIATPFDPQTGDVALDRLRDNAVRLLAQGLSGLVVGGSTGEAPLLDTDEVCRMVATAREAASPDHWVVAGTGAESTRAAVALTRAAVGAGADVVMVRPPGYFAAGHAIASLADHYRAVADASGAPVLLYNIPKYTHQTLAPELVRRVADHENIVGIKDSSGDLDLLAAYCAAAPHWAVLAGSAARMASALALGAAGGIVAVACFAAAPCVELHAAFRAGDLPRAEALQRTLEPLDHEIVGRYGPAGVKAAMDAVGLYGGPVRPPLAPLTASERERVARIARGD